MNEGVARIYTRTGDKGETSLLSGLRVKKNNKRILAYGEIDELNSYLGLVVATVEIDDIRNLLLKVQGELFSFGAELSAQTEEKIAKLPSRLTKEAIELIEKEIDRYNELLPPLREFILPGGSVSSAHLHVARTICRRAERSLIALAQDEAINPILLAYLNRLSDLLFVLARYVNFKLGIKDEPWGKKP